MKANLHYYKRPTVREDINYINRISFDFLTSPILKTISLFFEKKEKMKELNDFYTRHGLIVNQKNNKYGLSFGYLVKDHTKTDTVIINKKELFASQFDLRPGNIIAPALVSDDSLCRHIQITGASGSGKTVLIKSLFYQNASRGGGCFLVLGKGDNLMIQEFYSVACELKREKDFVLFDFVNGGRESVFESENKIINNSLNLFDIGGSQDLEEMIITLTKVENPNDWEQKTVDLIVAGVQTLYKLNEVGLLFDVEKIDEIVKSDNTLESIRMNTTEATGYQLLEYLTNYKNIFKLWAILEKLYIENKDFNDFLYPKSQKIDSNLSFESKLKLKERDKISFAIKKMIETVADRLSIDTLFARILDNPEEGIQLLAQEGNDGQSPLYAIGVAVSKFGSLINFFKKFELILNNATSDINIIDAFRLNKLIILNIPGQNAILAPLLGKMVTQILRKVNERYSNFIKPKETFMCFLDEINSWAKGTKDETLGIGEIMGVLRSANISCVVAHQTSLISMDAGTGVEEDKVTGNIEISIVLKTVSKKLVEELNSKFQKETRLVIKDSGENHANKNAKNAGIDVEIREFDAFVWEEISALKPGQGYFVKNGAKEKFVVELINSTQFSKAKDATIRIPVQKRVTKKYFLDSYFNGELEEENKNILEENLSFSKLDEPIKKSKPKLTAKAIQGSEFEQKLIALYKKEGWNVLDGTGDNFEEFDAEGIDIILEKENKVVLVQAKNWFKKELGRDEVILIIEKLSNFYRKKYYKKDIECYGILAVNEEIQITRPALQYLKDKEEDPTFRIETKKYKFD